MGCGRRAGRPEKARVGGSFGRAAHTYDGLAGLQRAVADTLLAKLAATGQRNLTAADVGCGTGYCAEKLLTLAPFSAVVALDIAPAMLDMTRRRVSSAAVSPVCGDAESLPLAAASMDVVVSNLAVQWCRDLEAVFREAERVLRPGGSLLFSTFGPATLRELRDAWRAADGYAHVNDFSALSEVSAALAAAGLGRAEVVVERRLSTYPDVTALMLELKGIGAHNVTAGRPRHLVGRGAFRRMLDAYERLRVEGFLPATFEVFYFTARKGG